MIKNIKFIIVGLIMLFPYAAKADIDVLSGIQDVMSTVQYYNDKVLEYQAMVSMYAQELTDSRKLVNKLRQEAEYYTAMGGVSLLEKHSKKLKINDKTMKGITEYIQGVTNNPKLERAVVDKFVPRVRDTQDVQKIETKRQEVNELLVENVATMYAKAIVRRRQIMKEDKEISDQEKGSDEAREAVLASDNDPMENIPQIMDEYKKVHLRAHSRWLSILDLTAKYQVQNGQMLMLESRAYEEGAGAGNE